MKTELTVTGMTCGGCAASVQGALQQVPGVSAVSVDLAKNMAQVDFDPSRVSIQRLIDTIEAAGFGAGPSS